MSLEKALENFASALGEYGCEFLTLEIDCPARNAQELATKLRQDCACDNVTWSVSDSRSTITCTTITGVDDEK